MMTNGRRTELHTWLRAELERANAEATQAGEAVRATAGRVAMLRKERAHNYRVTPDAVASAREAEREAERGFGRLAGKAQAISRLLVLLDELAAVEERVAQQAQAVARRVPELHELAEAFA